MKLLFMKQDALETLKSVLPDVFSRYYTEKENRWIGEVCGEDPFLEFKEIPDFSLAPLDSDLSKGEIDLENCKILYRNLMFISESQASDERLWAGLTHGVFYEYMRKRWGYDIDQPRAQKKSIGEIKTRYFFGGGARTGFYRNTLAKCWWVGRALYDKTSNNKFHKLDTLGSNDLSSKITDIFYSNTFSSNPVILDGIVNCFDYFNRRGIKLSVREQVRPTMQLLNAIGGGIILDCLSSDDITEIMIENIESILQGDKLSIKNINDNYIDEEEDIENGAEKDTDDELYVVWGCKVTVICLETNEEKKFKIDKINGSLPPITDKIMGMKEGEKFDMDGKKMRITAISF